MKIALVLLLVACGKPGANPCATRSATYVQKFTQTSGNCGALPDQVVNVSADGSIPAAANVTCQSQEPDGCTQRNTGCVGPTVDGVTCTATTSLTFVTDGSRATGTASITCSGAQSCASSYSLLLLRQ